MGKTWKIILNTVVFLVVIGFVWYIVQMVNKEDNTYVEASAETPFSSVYKEVSSFELSQEIKRFELQDGKLFIVSGESVYLYDAAGKKLSSFAVKQHVRDIAVGEGKIYLLYPTAIEVYTTDGKLSHAWEACSELSDYCSFALAGNFVFVTDAENKNICKYTKEGNFVSFIKSPVNFIIPSYTFDIASINDTVYCVNSGRHLIETYTLDGEFIASFGGPGGEAGSFVGCCNPVYISFTPQGELITSEKGNPRISVFERSGQFKEVILNSRLLGGGNKAYETQTDGNRLFVAGKNKMVVFTKE